MYKKRLERWMELERRSAHSQLKAPVYTFWLIDSLFEDSREAWLIKLVSLKYIYNIQVWCRRKQQKRGPGEKPEVAAPNGPRSQLPPTLEFPSPNLEVSFPAAICPEWDSGDI